jgi:hypothetical protein
MTPVRNEGPPEMGPSPMGHFPGQGVPPPHMGSYSGQPGTQHPFQPSGHPQYQGSHPQGPSYYGSGPAPYHDPNHYMHGQGLPAPGPYPGQPINHQQHPNPGVHHFPNQSTNNQPYQGQGMSHHLQGPPAHPPNPGPSIPQGSAQVNLATKYLLYFVRS